ncbi:hypothetical protein LX92_04404 [Maribacter polysiphoniae]|uniref:Uncharacterized protein n=1 Tax=Maribacter polysiphoniae TaxID=429344 RepID=A0A316E5A8_9FLAO|nr:hypothetical protein LX92_04404 [Maribacter polysiphoniae]
MLEEGKLQLKHSLANTGFNLGENVYLDDAAYGNKFRLEILNNNSAGRITYYYHMEY